VQPTKLFLPVYADLAESSTEQDESVHKQIGHKLKEEIIKVLNVEGRFARS